MKNFSIHFFLFILLSTLSISPVVAQQDMELMEDAYFTIKGSVISKDDNSPISRVNVEVNGGAYTITNLDGEFRIKAKIGDQIVIRHKDFETVYYEIESDERIRIEVEPEESGDTYSFKSKRKRNNFNALIDSASVYTKTDAAKSIQYVGDALKESTSVKQASEAYEVLGDVYMQWKQFDLAITNFRISLQNVETNNVQLKLAKAYELNRNYQESISIYESLDSEALSNWQKVVLFEQWGDSYYAIKSYETAIAKYQLGLNVAKTHLISPKETDLNSKIATAYNDLGQLEQARGYFTNSLNLASSENKTRAVEEQLKVADFQNTNMAYDDEIELRKQAIEVIEDIRRDSIIDNTSALTTQKQNYKIGSAYFLQKDYDNAIPYLEKSIAEADKSEDLVVKKDATRKLSDVYDDAGDYKMALSTYKDYTEVVDELYIKKEQEISQAAIFNRNIAEKQNRITSLESERLLTKSKYDLAEQKNKNQQIIIYSLLSGVLLLLGTAYFMYKYIKQQRLANNLLALKSLRSQMNPHFIFNALNSVNSFIASNDERTANRYLSDFSKLMRAVLENSEEDFIPLEKEVELLNLYTQLEHFRFQDKFNFSIDIDDDVVVSDYVIPPMLLQPYIENAVWHGLRYKKEKGFLKIHISNRCRDELVISITDNGIGRQNSMALKTDNQRKQNSKGMGNIKKRVAILNDMYKDKVDVFIDDYSKDEDCGTKVVVTLKKD